MGSNEVKNNIISTPIPHSLAHNRSKIVENIDFGLKMTKSMGFEVPGAALSSSRPENMDFHIDLYRSMPNRVENIDLDSDRSKTIESMPHRSRYNDGNSHRSRSANAIQHRSRSTWNQKQEI
jgi:hypothetical protein